MKRLLAVLFIGLLLATMTVAGCDKAAPNEVECHLSNPNATRQANLLYNYIREVNTHQVISGQQESTWMDSPDYEMDYIYEHTGKYPAIRGLDFINDDFDGVVERAKAWAALGGIVTICWHTSPNLDGGYEDCQNGRLTMEEWDLLTTDGTPQNLAYKQGLDKAGRALMELQEAGIPVLWRPYHEFNGWWFWWGKQGGDNFRKLWIMTYEYMTYELQLNNLIWVLGFSYTGLMMEDFYPGEEYYDIIGADSYYVNINGAEPRLYNGIIELAGDDKPLCMHETGLIPTVEQFAEAPWVYFMTWHTTWLIEDNDPDDLCALYNDPYVITLSDLPDFYGK